MPAATTPKHQGAAENHTAGNPRPGISSDDDVNRSNVVNSRQRKVAGVSAAELLLPVAGNNSSKTK